MSGEDQLQLPPMPERPPAPTTTESPESRELREECSRILQRVPKNFRRKIDELLPHVHGFIRSKLNTGAAPTLSCLLLGATGAGKTTAVAVLVRRAIHEYHHSARQRYAEVRNLMWVDAPDLSLTDRRHPLGDGQPPSLKDACEASLLVLDDIGLETNPSPLLEVLRFRYNNSLPTLATSGLTPKQLTSHISAAGVRRLTHQTAGHPVLVIDCHEKEKPGTK